MSVDKHASIRLTWALVALVIFGAGFGLVWWPFSQSIAAVRSHARELYEEANRNDAITLRASDLRAARARIHADLVTLGGVRSQGAVLSSTLRLLSEEGKRLRVDVRSIAPAQHAGGETHDPLVGTDVAIAVRGSFRNIVDMIADVPRHDVLVEIHDAQLVSADTMQGLPKLDVTLHATIYRLTLPERSDLDARTR